MVVAGRLRDEEQERTASRLITGKVTSAGRVAGAEGAPDLRSRWTGERRCQDSIGSPARPPSPPPLMANLRSPTSEEVEVEGEEVTRGVVGEFSSVVGAQGADAKDVNAQEAGEREARRPHDASADGEGWSGCH